MFGIHLGRIPARLVKRHFRDIRPYQVLIVCECSGDPMPAIYEKQGTVDMRQRNRGKLSVSTHRLGVLVDSTGINPLADL